MLINSQTAIYYNKRMLQIAGYFYYFITTGTFTVEAKKEATRDGAPAIDLIDGDGLIDMLTALHLGVKEIIRKEYEINEDWYRRI